MYLRILRNYTSSKILKINLIGSGKGKITCNNTAVFLRDDHEGRTMKRRLRDDRMKSSFYGN